MSFAALKFLCARGPATAAEALIEGRRLRDRGAWRGAERKFQKAVSLAKRDGERLREAEALHLISGVLLLSRRTEDARRFATEAMAIYREVGESGAAMQANHLAKTAEAMARR